MKRFKKSWIALLLGALLMATLVGAAGARPMRQTTYKLTIPAAHFHPTRDDLYWRNEGNVIYSQSGAVYFWAALPIALPGRFTVEKMTLFAYDDNSSNAVAAHLYRMNPWTGDFELMANVWTTGQSSTIQRPSTTSFSPDTIYGGHGGYIALTIQDSWRLSAYAVQIEYH